MNTGANAHPLDYIRSTFDPTISSVLRVGGIAIETFPRPPPIFESRIESRMDRFEENFSSRVFFPFFFLPSFLVMGLKLFCFLRGLKNRVTTLKGDYGVKLADDLLGEEIRNGDTVCKRRGKEKKKKKEKEKRRKKGTDVCIN